MGELAVAAASAAEQGPRGSGGGQPSGAVPSPMAWDPSQPSTSAAAAAIAAAAAALRPLPPEAAEGTGAAAAGPAPAPAPVQQPPAEDYSSLAFLRSLIPPEVLQEYGSARVMVPAEKEAVQRRLRAFHQEMKLVKERQEAKVHILVVPQVSWSSSFVAMLSDYL
jgi:hypothetical protein